MFEFRADYNRLLSRLSDAPAMLKRANRSALSSIGFWIRGNLRDYVRSGGEGWTPVSYVTRRLKKTYGDQAVWRKRARAAKQGPYYWLARFARYQVEKDASRVTIGFGKSRAGFGLPSIAKKVPNMDAFLMAVAMRAETGETVRVTQKMRGYFGWLRGRSFKKSTKYIIIRRRPIFGPVRRAVGPEVPGRYEEKFLANLERYWNETT